MTVVIDGKRILKVGRSDLIPPAEGPVIDGSGKSLLPGLIDSHVHLCADPERPNRYDPLAISTEGLAVAVLSHAQQALGSGVTTVADCGGRGMVTLGVRDAIAAGLATGPTILTTGPGLTITNGHFHFFAREVDGRDEIRKTVRQLCKSGIDFLKVFGTGGGATMSSNPALAQFSVEEMRIIVEEVERAGIRATTHVHGAPGILNAVEAGFHRLEHVQFFDEHNRISLDQSIVERIAEAGIPISLGMARRWRTDDSIEQHLTPRQLEQRVLRVDRIEALRHYRTMGIPLIPSTDAGMTMTPFGDLPHLLGFLAEELDYSSQQIIHAATGLAAEALGISDSCGTIEPGKNADLLVVNNRPSGEPILHDPFLVMKHGAVVRSGLGSSPSVGTIMTGGVST